MGSSLSDITQKQWIKACKKLGLSVNISAGKGSHAIVKDGNSQNRAITIQHSLNPLISRKIMKRLIEWGFTEEEIKKALK